MRHTEHREKCNLFGIVLCFCLFVYVFQSSSELGVMYCHSHLLVKCHRISLWSNLNEKLTKLYSSVKSKQQQQMYTHKPRRDNNKIKQLVLDASLEWCWSKCYVWPAEKKKKSVSEKTTTATERTWRNSRWRNNCCVREKTKETV